MVVRKRISTTRVVALVAVLAVLGFGALYRPSWPQDLLARFMGDNVDFRFSQKPLCDSERSGYQPDELKLGSNRREITAYVSLGCSDRAGSPAAMKSSGALYLSISAQPIDPESDLAAACYCSNELTFEFQEPIVRGQEVIFVSGLQRTASLVAP